MGFSVFLGPQMNLESVEVTEHEFKYSWECMKITLRRSYDVSTLNDQIPILFPILIMAPWE